MGSATEAAAVGAVILAAGRGQRMGADKALLDIGGTSAVERAVATCRAAGADDVVVVRARGAAALPDAVSAVRVAEVEPGCEMVASVRAGLAAAPGGRASVLFPVDYAMVAPATVWALVRARAQTDAEIALPICDDRPGHPLVLSGAAVAAMLAGPAPTLRDFVRAHPALGVPTTDRWTQRDLDRPEDLALARAALRDRGSFPSELMRAHRSRRAFHPDPIPAEQLAWLVDSARHASTSSFIQAYAVVAVRDPGRKAAVARLCADQQHIHQAPLFLAICADLHKIALCCTQRGLTLDSDPLEIFVQATVDAALLGQNLLLAAEAEGLGGCMIGAARNHPVELARLLQLPPHVFVVFGMVLGRPADDPPARGRMPLAGVLFEERYDPSRLPEVVTGADEAMRAWARAVNAGGGYRGKPVSEHKGWSDRVAAAWSKEKGTYGSRAELAARLRELGFGLR